MEPEDNRDTKTVRSIGSISEKREKKTGMDENPLKDIGKESHDTTESDGRQKRRLFCENW